MQEVFTKIQSQITEFVANAEKQINKGNKAAGTRARKASSELAKLLKEFRAKSTGRD